MRTLFKKNNNIQGASIVLLGFIRTLPLYQKIENICKSDRSEYVMSVYVRAEIICIRSLNILLAQNGILYPLDDLKYSNTFF